MSDPIVSRLWIAAADAAINASPIGLSLAARALLRARLSTAAIEVEALMSVVAHGSSRQRRSVIAEFVERFGADADDVDRIAARVVSDAIVDAGATAGLTVGKARALAKVAHDAILEAGSQLDAAATELDPLTDGPRLTRILG